MNGFTRSRRDLAGGHDRHREVHRDGAGVEERERRQSSVLRAEDDATWCLGQNRLPIVRGLSAQIRAHGVLISRTESFAGLECTEGRRKLTTDYRVATWDAPWSRATAAFAVRLLQDEQLRSAPHVHPHIDQLRRRSKTRPCRELQSCCREESTKRVPDTHPLGNPNPGARVRVRLLPSEPDPSNSRRGRRPSPSLAPLRESDLTTADLIPPHTVLLAPASSASPEGGRCMQRKPLRNPASPYQSQLPAPTGTPQTAISVAIEHHPCGVLGHRLLPRFRMRRINRVRLRTRCWKCRICGRQHGRPGHRRDRAFDTPVARAHHEDFRRGLAADVHSTPGSIHRDPARSGDILDLANQPPTRHIENIHTICRRMCNHQIPVRDGKSFKARFSRQIHHGDTAQISAPQRTRESQDSNRD